MKPVVDLVDTLFISLDLLKKDFIKIRPTDNIDELLMWNLEVIFTLISSDKYFLICNLIMNSLCLITCRQFLIVTEIDKFDFETITYLFRCCKILCTWGFVSNRGFANQITQRQKNFYVGRNDHFNIILAEVVYFGLSSLLYFLTILTFGTIFSTIHNLSEKSLFCNFITVDAM